MEVDLERPSAPQLLLLERKTADLLGRRAKWNWRAACEGMKHYYIRNDFEYLWGPSDQLDVIKVKGA